MQAEVSVEIESQSVSGLWEEVSQRCLLSCDAINCVWLASEFRMVIGKEEE